MKIKAIKIEVPFSEGLPMAPKEFIGENCWEQFQKFANLRAKDYEFSLNGKPWLGYLKTDFKIVFLNGEIYRGRYDITKDGFENGKTLAEHIRDFILFNSGQKCPKHLKKEDYTDFLSKMEEKIKIYYRNFLDIFEIPA